MEDRQPCGTIRHVDDSRAQRKHANCIQEELSAATSVSMERSCHATVGTSPQQPSPATRGGGCGDRVSMESSSIPGADIVNSRRAKRSRLRRGDAVWLVAIPLVASLWGGGFLRTASADRVALRSPAIYVQGTPESRLQKEFWNMEIPQLRESVSGALELPDGDSWTSGPSDSFGADSCSRAASPNLEGDDGRARSPSSDASSQEKRGRKRAAPESKVCRHVEGCDKWANFGDEASHIPLFCKQHKQPGHRNVVSRRCTSPGCGKRPVFGDPLDRVRRFCRQHKLEHHVDVANKRCRFPHCRKHPIYGEMLLSECVKTDESEKAAGSEEEGKTQPGEAKYCADHKGPQHVDVRHKRCEQGGCYKLSSFADPGSRSPRFCSTHKLPGQVYVLAAACSEEGCLRRPSFAFVAGGWDQRCAKHRLPGQLRGRSLSALQRDKPAAPTPTTPDLALAPAPSPSPSPSPPMFGAPMPLAPRLEHGPRPLLCHQT